VYGASVNAYSASGALLGSGTTSTSTGSASLSLSGYTAGTPIIVKVTLSAGAKYYDEKSNTEITLAAGATPVSLLSVAPSITSGSSLGVTPLTNMAAKLAGLDAAAVTGSTLSTSITSAKIYEGVAKTNLIMGLPTSTNLLAAPVPAKLGAATPSDTYGLLLAKIAIAAPTNALTQATSLVAAVKTDGTVETANLAAITTANTALSTSASALGLTVSAPDTTLNTNTVNAAVTAVTATITSGTKPSGSGSGSGSGSSIGSTN